MPFQVNRLNISRYISEVITTGLWADPEPIPQTLRVGQGYSFEQISVHLSKLHTHSNVHSSVMTTSIFLHSMRKQENLEDTHKDTGIT